MGWADTRGDSKSETKFPGSADRHPSEVEVALPFLGVNLRTFHGVGDEEAGSLSDPNQWFSEESSFSCRLKSSNGQSHAPPGGPRGESLLAFQLPVALGFLGLWQHNSSLCFCLYLAFSQVSLNLKSPSPSLSFIGTPVNWM